VSKLDIDSDNKVSSFLNAEKISSLLNTEKASPLLNVEIPLNEALPGDSRTVMSRLRKLFL
jgi:hypothetical protein